MGSLLVCLLSKCLAENESHSLLSLDNSQVNDESDLLSLQSIQSTDLVAAEGKHYSKKHGHFKKHGGHHDEGKHGKHSHGKYGGGYKHHGHNYKKKHKHGGY